MHDLTAIVPIDLAYRPLDILQKAFRLAKACESNGLRIIFGHNDRSTIYDKILKKIIEHFALSTCTSRPLSATDINSAALRNLAFEDVKTKYIILLDVDLHLDFDVVSRYYNRVHASIDPFAILPCLYLTKLGSNRLIRKKITIKKLKERYFNYSRKEFLHLASPSSVTILTSNDYATLNGFDIDFHGHGYEDFDFLVRLAALHKKITPSKNFFANIPHRAPLLSEGFRQSIGLLCLNALMNQDFIFHIYHSSPKRSNYHKNRASNFLRFREKHKEFEIQSDIVFSETEILANFIDACLLTNQKIQDYSIYLDNRPGHADRFDTFRRRMRFLLNE
jgi:predicted glycosyltransferase involved in capsule biosynthesis